MKKVLASIGIGNASVDTVLPNESVRPGETVEADVHVTGGDATQEVGAIRFDLETRVETEEGYDDVDVARYSITDDLTIEPDNEETRSVSLDIPYETPVTVGRADVWVETELDIDLAVDPEDTDRLDVEPTPRLQAVFDAMDDLGFSLRTAGVEADPYGRYASGRRFVQEFEFRANAGRFRDALDELELVARPGAEALELYVEVDRRGGLLSEMAETDERKTGLTVESTDVDVVREQLSNTIEEYT